MNFIQIMGHLGADAVTRFTPSGQKVTNFNVATNVRRGGKDETVWYKVVIWGDRFDKMLPYVKKGTGIVVMGELGKPEVYTDKEGRTQITLEVTADTIRFSPFGKSEKQDQLQNQYTQNKAPQAVAAPASTNAFSDDDSDDGLPF